MIHFWHVEWHVEWRMHVNTNSDALGGGIVVYVVDFAFILVITFKSKHVIALTTLKSKVAYVTLNFKLSFFALLILFYKQSIQSGGLITRHLKNNIYGTKSNVNKSKHPFKLVYIYFLNSNYLKLIDSNVR